MTTKRKTFTERTISAEFAALLRSCVHSSTDNSEQYVCEETSTETDNTNLVAIPKIKECQTLGSVTNKARFRKWAANLMTMRVQKIRELKRLLEGNELLCPVNDLLCRKKDQNIQSYFWDENGLKPDSVKASANTWFGNREVTRGRQTQLLKVSQHTFRR